MYERGVCMRGVISHQLKHMLHHSATAVTLQQTKEHIKVRVKTKNVQLFQMGSFIRLFSHM